MAAPERKLDRGQYTIRRLQERLHFTDLHAEGRKKRAKEFRLNLYSFHKTPPAGRETRPAFLLVPAGPVCYTRGAEIKTRSGW